jgi:hypothetical protein
VQESVAALAEKKVWLQDINGVKHLLDLMKLMCVVQDPVLPRCRDFYFTSRTAPYCLPLSWQDAATLLETHRVESFITKGRSQLVIRSFIERYERPFVRLRGINLKFEVVADKHAAFEDWLTKKDIQ